MFRPFTSTAQHRMCLKARSQLFESGLLMNEEPRESAYSLTKQQKTTHTEPTTKNVIGEYICIHIAVKLWTEHTTRCYIVSFCVCVCVICGKQRFISRSVGWLSAHRCSVLEKWCRHRVCTIHIECKMCVLHVRHTRARAPAYNMFLSLWRERRTYACCF